MGHHIIQGFCNTSGSNCIGLVLSFLTGSWPSFVDYDPESIDRFLATHNYGPPVEQVWYAGRPPSDYIGTVVIWRGIVNGKEFYHVGIVINAWYGEDGHIFATVIGKNGIDGPVTIHVINLTDPSPSLPGVIDIYPVFWLRRHAVPAV